MYTHSAISAFPTIRLRNKRGEPSGSPSVSWLLLSGFACGDPVGRRSADAEGSSIVGFGCANSYESGGLRVYRHLVETELPQIPPDPVGTGEAGSG